MRTKRRITGIGALVTAAFLAACTAGAGVHSDRADTADTVPTSSGDTIVSESSAPPETPPLDTTVRPDGDADLGAGDSLFPSLGNPGIDVEHYDLAIRYDPDVDIVSGDVTATLHFTDTRDAFTLDSAGPKVSRVVVDGVDVAFRQEPPELWVELGRTVAPGDAAEVTVSFALSPLPNESIVGITNGWFGTPGGSYVLNEPDGASTWFPCNDHPSDKATYSFEISVPAGVTAVANGTLVERRDEGGTTTFVWDEPYPMATYLMQLLTGDYEIVDDGAAGDVAVQHVALRDDVATMQPFFDVTADQIAFFETEFGPFPFDHYGVAMTDSMAGLAMETQGRSLFSRDDFAGGELLYVQQVLLSHELAHQWFGDAVTPAQWADIWLNESFATYAQWLWLDHVGLQPLADSADLALLSRPDGSTGSPSPDELFGYDSYDGGAVVLEALRRTIGDDAFHRLLREWVSRNIGESRTTLDFIGLAEEISGSDLRAFFDTWLYAPRTPRSYP